MQNIGLIIGSLIQIAGGIYLALLFGRAITPNFKDDEKREYYLKLKKNHGSKLVILGALLIAFGVFQLVRGLFF
ncbi:MAG: hypothetical protein KDC84_12810 [Crocinitomicaceae bacterium]|nr:hypothetical protein [Crocinitomicaceae bacterium]